MFYSLLLFTNVVTSYSYINSQSKHKKPDEIYEEPQVLDLGIVSTSAKPSTQRTTYTTPYSYLSSQKKLKNLMKSMKCLKFSTWE